MPLLSLIAPVSLAVPVSLPVARLASATATRERRGHEARSRL